MLLLLFTLALGGNWEYSVGVRRIRDMRDRLLVKTVTLLRHQPATHKQTFLQEVFFLYGKPTEIPHTLLLCGLAGLIRNLGVTGSLGLSLAAQ